MSATKLLKLQILPLILIVPFWFLSCGDRTLKEPQDALTYNDLLEQLRSAVAEKKSRQLWHSADSATRQVWFKISDIVQEPGVKSKHKAFFRDQLRLKSDEYHLTPERLLNRYLQRPDHVFQVFLAKEYQIYASQMKQDEFFFVAKGRLPIRLYKVKEEKSGKNVWKFHFTLLQ